MLRSTDTSQKINLKTADNTLQIKNTDKKTIAAAYTAAIAALINIIVYSVDYLTSLILPNTFGY